MVMAVGMSTPPVKPCPARQMIISVRLLDMAHRIEKPTNNAELIDRKRRSPMVRESQAVSGMTMISAIR